MTDIQHAILGSHDDECPCCRATGKTREFMKGIVERTKLLIISMRCGDCQTSWRRIQSPLLTERG